MDFPPGAINMKLILQKDVKNLGKAGDQVLVKKGYARNFLIPKGQALPLNKDRLKAWKHQQIIIEARKRKALEERKKLIEKLSSLRLKFEKESLKDGRLFGSVTAFDISHVLETKHNISVDKRDISPAILKTAGEHKAVIQLDKEHKTDIAVVIKAKTVKKREQKASEQALAKNETEITAPAKNEIKEDSVISAVEQRASAGEENASEQIIDSKDSIEKEQTDETSQHILNHEKESAPITSDKASMKKEQTDETSQHILNHEKESAPTTSDKTPVKKDQTNKTKQDVPASEKKSSQTTNGKTFIKKEQTDKTNRNILNHEKESALTTNDKASVKKDQTNKTKQSALTSKKESGQTTSSKKLTFLQKIKKRLKTF